MKLKASVVEQYSSVLHFWYDACNYKGTSEGLRGRCCKPETKKYQQKCDNLWSAWHKAGSRGKRPVMPKATVECEKCLYADLTLGSFQGRASERTICRHVEGTIPVPLKGRKKVWLDNINQKQLDVVIDEIDRDIEAFAITGSPTVKDFTFLERFSKLKYVYLWWNNKATSLWDITKTPNIEFLQLDQINRLTDISQLQNAKKLRYLKIWEGKDNIESLTPLIQHPSLEFIDWSRMVDDTDMSTLITISNLKYLACHFNLFDINSYAMFEAKRSDVDTNFFEGLAGYENDISDSNPYFVGLVGKRQGMAKFSDKAKQEKHRSKYLAIKQKYLATNIKP